MSVPWTFRLLASTSHLQSPRQRQENQYLLLPSLVITVRTPLPLSLLLTLLFLRFRTLFYRAQCAQLCSAFVSNTNYIFKPLIHLPEFNLILVLVSDSLLENHRGNLML